MIVRRKNNEKLSPSLSLGEYSKTSLPKLYCSLSIYLYNFGRVQQFKYLGMIVTENNNTKKEIEARIQAGNKCIFGLAKLLRARSLSRDKETIMHYLVKISCFIWSKDLGNLENRRKQTLLFKKKNSEKNLGPVKDNVTNKWSIRNKENRGIRITVSKSKHR